MAAVSKQELISYCRAYEEDGDELVALCESAQGYLDGAGVREPEEDSPKRTLYLTVCKMYTLHLFEREETVSRSLQTLINQLKFGG